MLFRIARHFTASICDTCVSRAVIVMLVFVAVGRLVGDHLLYDVGVVLGQFKVLCNGNLFNFLNLDYDWYVD